MNNGPLVEKSTQYALDIIKLTKELYKNNEFVLSKQLLRCSTSIGANIREANYAQSKADFISKLYISLKECNESDYWLELLVRSNYINDVDYKALIKQCHSIRAMLVKSINTAKTNLE